MTDRPTDREADIAIDIKKPTARLLSVSEPCTNQILSANFKPLPYRMSGYVYISVSLSSLGRWSMDLLKGFALISLRENDKTRG